MRERRSNHLSRETSDERLERLFGENVRSLGLLAAKWPAIVEEVFEIADLEGNIAVLAEREYSVGGAETLRIVGDVQKDTFYASCSRDTFDDPMQIVAGCDQNTVVLLDCLLSLSPDRIGALDDLLGQTEVPEGERLAKHFDHFTPRMRRQTCEVVLFLGDNPDLRTTYSVCRAYSDGVGQSTVFQYTTQTREGEIIYGEQWTFNNDGRLRYVSTPGFWSKDQVANFPVEQLLERCRAYVNMLFEVT